MIFLYSGGYLSHIINGRYCIPDSCQNHFKMVSYHIRYTPWHPLVHIDHDHDIPWSCLMCVSKMSASPQFQGIYHHVHFWQAPYLFHSHGDTPNNGWFTMENPSRNGWFLEVSWVIGLGLGSSPILNTGYSDIPLINHPLLGTPIGWKILVTTKY